MSPRQSAYSGERIMQNYNRNGTFVDSHNDERQVSSDARQLPRTHMLVVVFQKETPSKHHVHSIEGCLEVVIQNNSNSTFLFMFINKQDREEFSIHFVLLTYSELQI